MEFKDKLKAVRLKLFMSQEMIAKELGVSFSTVNRWENGITKPNFKAQKAFYELCQKNKIDLQNDLT